MTYYIAHKTFYKDAICGQILISKGAILQEYKGYLFFNKKLICSATSENAWEYFHLNTPEGEWRYRVYSTLEEYIENGGDITIPQEWRAKNRNQYWKNLIRTAPNDLLKQFLQEANLNIPEIEGML